ncbi:lanthionine synthetase LanC family protein [Ascidiimonas sp. W6]|uniref:lanthionine synthetase LanC family protein n=1 Tax=Ascidiimonas meishanensis TaxID=3128903 RepID=UPI0030EEB01C
MKSAKFQKQLDFMVSLSEQKTSIEEKIIVVNILIQSYLLTEEKKYITFLSLFVNQKEAHNFMGSGVKNHCFENGKSGFLLILLYTFPYLKEGWMLSYIKNLMDSFIASLFPYQKESLIYISGEHAIAPLCELYEGNSGMALVFMQLGTFFKSPVLYIIADKLISYEDTLWNAETKNYPDYRKKITSLKEHHIRKEKYLNKEYDYLSNPGDNIGFKNGAIGIAFTRLKAFECTNNEKYLKSFKKALKKINLVLHMDSHLLSKSETKLIHQLNNSDTIVFPPLFQEVLPLKEPAVIAYATVLRSHLRVPYFITLKIAENLNLDLVKEFSVNYNEDLYKKTNPLKSFYFFTKALLKKANMHGANLLKDILRLEYKKIKLQKSMKSLALLEMEDLVQVAQRDVFLTLDEAHLLNTELILNKNLLLVKTKWKWIVDEFELFMDLFDPTENMNKDTSVNYAVLKVTSQYDTKRKTYIHEKSLSEYQYIILDLFEYPVTVIEVIEEFLTLFEINTDAELQSVKKMVLDIVEEAIFDRFLVAP